MYSVEYKWTSEETPLTTINITVDKGSKQNPQLIIKSSEAIHGAKKISQLEPKITVSKKAKRESKKEVKMANVDKMHEPLIPIKRPKQTQVRKLTKGKTRMQKYIKIKFFKGSR